MTVIAHPLRIGMVSHAGVGGSGVVASQLAELMARNGHEVHVFSTATPPRAAAASERLFFHTLATPEYPVFDAPPYTLAMASAVAAGIDEYALDVVHVHYALPYAVSAQLALQMAKRTPRLIVTLHGTDVTGVGADAAYAPALRNALRHADIVTTPSRALALDALGRGLVATAPVVVANFVDASRFDPTGPVALPPMARIAHMSNFRPVKRTTWLVDALATAREHTETELLLIGDGPELGAVQRAAEDAGVRDAVRCVGIVDDPGPWLRSSSVFALPSEDESFGLSALEAMACGLPVVGCNVGGLSEVVQPHQTGELVASDGRAFADAVSDLLKSPARAAELGRAGLARAQQEFPPSKALAGYLNVYSTAP